MHVRMHAHVASQWLCSCWLLRVHACAPPQGPDVGEQMELLALAAGAVQPGQGLVTLEERIAAFKAWAATL